VIQCEQALKTLGSAKAQAASEKEKIEATTFIGKALAEEKRKSASNIENDTEALRRFWSVLTFSQQPVTHAELLTVKTSFNERN
jgi:hypothetical protein